MKAPGPPLGRGLGFGTPLPRRALKVSLPLIRQSQPASVPSTQLNNASCSFTVPPLTQSRGIPTLESARHPVPRAEFWTGRLVSPLPTQSSSCRALSPADAPCRRCSALLWACRSFTRLDSFLPQVLAHSWFFQPLIVHLLSLLSPSPQLQFRIGASPPLLHVLRRLTSPCVIRTLLPLTSRAFCSP